MRVHKFYYRPLRRNVICFVLIFSFPVCSSKPAVKIIKLPEINENFNMTTHLKFDHIKKICASRIIICESNATRVCSVRFYEGKKEYKEFNNSCYVFLSNMCDNPGQEYHIISSGNCSKHTLRRSEDLEAGSDENSEYVKEEQNENTLNEENIPPTTVNKVIARQQKPKIAATMKKGVANKGTTKKGVANKGTTKKAVPNKGTTKKAAANKGTTKKALANKGTTKKAAANKGTTKKVVTNKGTTKKAVTNKGTTKKPVINKGTTRKGVANQGTTKKVVANQGTTKKVAANQGTTKVTNKVTTKKIDVTKIKEVVTTDSFKFLYEVETAFDDHICPLACPNTYSPVCVSANRGYGMYFKFFTFMNHCLGDLYYCKHWEEFAPPPEESEMVISSPLSWSFCGSSRYLAFARFSEVASSMGHYGWLSGDHRATHIMEPHERQPGFG